MTSSPQPCGLSTPPLSDGGSNAGKHVDVDHVNHPPHYAQHKHEPIAVIEDWGLDFCLGNAVKYIARAGKKDPAKEIEDLKKSAWYLARRIARLESAAPSLPPTSHTCVFMGKPSMCGICGTQWSAK